MAYTSLPSPLPWQNTPVSSSSGSLLDLVTDLAPLITTGANYLTGSDSIDTQKDITTTALRDSADRLNRGYDEKQAFTEQGIDELMNLLSAGLQETTNSYRRAGFNYADASKRAMADYGAQIQPLLSQLTEGMTLSSDIYGANLDQTEGKATASLEEGAKAVEGKYQPYMDAGGDALGYLQQVMGIDPNTLTPDQKIMLEDLTRDLTANLAASELRGAGRAGVAAVGDSLGRTRAELFKQNQARKDAAANTLNTQGYNATGQVADSLEGLKKGIADLQYKTGTSKATNTFNVGSNIANTAFKVGQDTAQKSLGTNQDIAKTEYGINKGVTDLTGQYYKDVGSLQSDRYNERGKTAMGKAQVDSSAGLNVANAEVGAEQAGNSLFSSALDKLGTTLAKNRAASFKNI